MQSAAGNATDDDDDEDDDDDDSRPFTPPPPRGRLSYTRYQLELLNGIYQEVRYPNTVQKQLIAKRVGITREQVKIWFQNRRRKDVVGSRAGNRDAATAEKSTNDSTSATRDAIISTTASSRSTSPSVCSKEEDSPDAEGASDMLYVGNGATGDNRAGHEADLRGANVGKTASRMVPEVVMRSVISELGRFSSDKLKSKKNKRKNRLKQRGRTPSSSSSSAGGGSGGGGGVPVRFTPGGMVAGEASDGSVHARSSLSRLFCPYDMVAPPNKVTPTAFLNTAANRFYHSYGSSAFSSPRDIRPDSLPPGGGMACMPNLEGVGLSPGMGGAVPSDASHHHHHHPVLSGLGMAGVGLMPVGQPPGTGAHEGLPVLSDMLGPHHHRHPLDSSTLGREVRESSSQPHPAEDASENRSTTHHHNHLSPFNMSSSSAPSLSMNRVFPFPIFADPPIVLSNLNQHESLRGHSSWPALPPTHLNPMSTLDESYKPVLISSITNPFYTHSSPTPHWPIQHTAPDSSSAGGFTQL
ncbi:homeotic protein ocelliless-like isoform X2 [Pomacea canaliculata]|nr:homeotic protein ocelliless-like isoform X2 [Pomacea canaliculata]